VASDPWRLRLTLDLGGMVGFTDHHRYLAKPQIFNHLAATPAERAGDVVSFDLVDFLLHALPSHGTAELSSDHVSPRVPTAVAAAPTPSRDERGSAGLAPGETAH
jgi:hypothetical protein